MSGAASSEGSPGAGPTRYRYPAEVMGGLLLTLAGLVGFVLSLPSSSGYSPELGWAGVSFLTAWVGGILTGNALRPLPPGVRPAVRGQAGVGLIGTVAGALAAVALVDALAPPGAAGRAAAAVLAGVSAGLAWVGGFLMGHAMRRFSRRPRRGGRPAPEPAATAGAAAER